MGSWILTGNLGSTTNTSSSHLCVDSDNDIDNFLTKFWTLENVDIAIINMSNEDKHCEYFLYIYTYRDETGRLIVRIPFKENVAEFGSSREIAKHRFVQFSNKIIKKPRLTT